MADALARISRARHAHPGRGSPALVRTLLCEGLLDELAISICPVVVGTGARLFDETTHDVSFKLVRSRVLGTGVLDVTYQPQRLRCRSGGGCHR